MSRGDQEAALWPEALEDEGLVQTFLPGYGRLRDYLEDHALPFAMLDPMRHGQRPDASLGTGYRIESNNQRDYLGGTLTEAQWSALRQAFDNRCAYCLNAMQGGMVIEHVVPLCKGGRTRLENVVPACRPCNASKGRRSVDLFLGDGAPAFFARWAVALVEAKKKAG